MAYVADLHLHSPYAYATSKALTLENLSEWASLKGIDLLACGDFTHPVWFDELCQKLEPDASGLYQFNGMRFVLGTEVSCVYRQGGRQRRVHILLFAPSFDVAAQLNRALASYGDLTLDGRPTLSLSARDLTALTLELDPECIVIPAHVWTPWYGVFGSKSGFDRLEECFQDMTPAIHAVETGLSSDPAMNWGMPELADKTIASFSDAHSLPKLAREATVFEGDLSYQGLAEALAQNQVAYTVEFYPEEGKYHYDGHRKCGISQPPEETLSRGTRCPVCGRPLTLGVLHRTKALSQGDAPYKRSSDGFVRSLQSRPPYIRLVPLQEVIAAALGQSPNTKRVQGEYRRITDELGSELHVLINAPPADLEKAAGERLARAILQVRTEEVQVEPGYDGVFGKVSLPPADAPALAESGGSQTGLAGL